MLRRSNIDLTQAAADQMGKIPAPHTLGSLRTRGLGDMKSLESGGVKAGMGKEMK